MPFIAGVNRDRPTASGNVEVDGDARESRPTLTQMSEMDEVETKMSASSTSSRSVGIAAPAGHFLLRRLIGPVDGTSVQVISSATARDVVQPCSGWWVEWVTSIEFGG